MNLAEQFVVFLVSWWLVFFMVLPIGVKTVEEAGGEVEPGTVPSAPSNPHILRKMGITTVIALIILLLAHLANKYNLISVNTFYN